MYPKVHYKKVPRLSLPHYSPLVFDGEDEDSDLLPATRNQGNNKRCQNVQQSSLVSFILWALRNFAIFSLGVIVAMAYERHVFSRSFGTYEMGFTTEYIRESCYPKLR